MVGRVTVCLEENHLGLKDPMRVSEGQTVVVGVMSATDAAVPELRSGRRMQQGEQGHFAVQPIAQSWLIGGLFRLVKYSLGDSLQCWSNQWQPSEDDATGS